MAEDYSNYLTPEQLQALSGIGSLGSMNILGGADTSATQPYRTFVAPLSNKGNPTSKLGGNQIVVYENQPVRLVDNRTGTVAYEGTGYEAAQKAIELGQDLSNTYGRKASWNIQTLDPYANSYVNVATEKKNKSLLGKIGSVVGTALPLAVSFIPGIGQLATGLQVAIGAGAGAAGSALRGDNILKGALMGGLTSAGGQLLKGPISSGLNVSGKVASGIGSGIGATAGGLATGQSLQDSLLGGVASGGLSYLGSELRSSMQGAKPNTSGIGGGDVPSGDIIVTGTRPISIAAPSVQTSSKAPERQPISSDELVITGTRPVSILPPSFGGTPIVENAPVEPNDRQDMTDKQMEEIFGLAPGGTGLSTKDWIRLGLLAPSLIKGIAGGGSDGAMLTPDRSAVITNPLGRTQITPGESGAGLGAYGFDPFSYGQATGNQPGEYAFFTPANLTPIIQAPTTSRPVVIAKAEGGYIDYAEGGEMNDDMVKHLVEYRKGGGHDGDGPVKGIGSGQEDKIPAWLSDGEYVWSAQDVADLGDGSGDEGIRRLDKMRQLVRKRAGRKDVKKIAKPQKGIEHLLAAVGGK